MVDLLWLTALGLFTAAIVLIACDARPGQPKIALGLFGLSLVFVAVYVLLGARASDAGCDEVCLVGTFPETEDMVLNGALPE